MLHEHLGHRRRAWVALLGLTLTAAGWAQGTLAACALAGGGTASTPWKVTSAAALAKVGLGSCLLSGYYAQTADINLAAYSAGLGWKPIGPDRLNPFIGTYDGGRHAITGLLINSTKMGGAYFGLFGFNTGTLKNLKVSGTVSGFSYVGGLAGFNSGTLTQVSASGAVTGYSAAGGLVGVNSGTLTQVSASGAVGAVNWMIHDGSNFGGLVGYNSGTLTQASASGTVSGHEYAGGLIGFNSGTLTHVSASGAVSGKYSIGGLVGYNYGPLARLSQASASGTVYGYSAGGLVGFNYQGTLTQVSASGAVTGYAEAGGLVGANSGTLTQASASGAVILTSYGGAGGLVGSNQGTLTQVSASGTVTSSSSSSGLGGLVGENYSTITQASASGAVSASASDVGSYVGGFVGYNNGAITASFWDLKTTQQSNGVGSGSAAGLRGKSTAELQTLTTFSSVGWPIVAGWLAPASAGDKAWGICPAANTGYPFLLWAYPTNPCASTFGTFTVTRLAIDKSLKNFFLASNFTLGTHSNGINPNSETVTFKIASFTTTIPFGSFRKTAVGIYSFTGKVDNVAIEATITPLALALGKNRFEFKVAASGVSINTGNPVTVKLGIDDDNGTTTTTAVIK